jgi:DNA-binding transcriptional LysR family regulator
MGRVHGARRRLKLRQLEILVAVADTGSMAKAAARLAISQPAISRAVADAEHTLGVSLFERSPQGVSPTQYGHALLKRGIAAFDEIDQGVRDIEFLADPTAGELRIGTPAGVSEGIVLAAINRLSRQYPRVVFHVAIATGSTLLGQLRGREIELGFDPLSGPVGEEDIDVEMLYDEPLVVVAGIDNPWLRRRRIKLAELVNEPWTWRSSSRHFTRTVSSPRARQSTPTPSICGSAWQRQVRSLLSSLPAPSACPGNILRSESWPLISPQRTEGFMFSPSRRER